MQKLVLIFVAVTWCSSALTQVRIRPDSGKLYLLNTASSAEAYPFISNDGLRLYYTSGKEDRGGIYFAVRKSINDSFRTSLRLSKSLPDKFVAGTLTSNELEIYMWDLWRVYFSKRETINDLFPTPTFISELGDNHRTPAISPNGEELVAVFNSLSEPDKNSIDSIRVFKKDMSGRFRRIYTLNYPRGFRPGPGQFSKDGLCFFISINKQIYEYGKVPFDSICSLMYKRSSLQETFTGYEFIFEDLTNENRPDQISFTLERKIMIGVLSIKNRWNKNNLMYYHVLD